MLEFLAARTQRITFFVVGQDAALERNEKAIRAIADDGHEIGNHSFRHEPWLHRYSLDEIDAELGRAEEAISRVTGQRTIGFRGPGYSLSADVLRVLVDRGYRYDCSTLPTVIGPLARRYYFRSAKLIAEQRAERELPVRRRPGRPAPAEARTSGRSGGDRLLEIPVTTLPLARVPIHVSYVLYLAAYSPGLARQYFANALRLCRLRRRRAVDPAAPARLPRRRRRRRARVLPGHGHDRRAQARHRRRLRRRAATPVRRGPDGRARRADLAGATGCRYGACSSATPRRCRAGVDEPRPAPP